MRNDRKEDKMSQERIINVARGLEKADLVIKNANIVNVLSEEIHKADVAIVDGIIAGISDSYQGEKEIDVNGAYITPSFIDGHVHLESAMILPKEFAKTVLPAGTTTAIIDPHEISNVFGLHGISFMQCLNVAMYGRITFRKAPGPIVICSLSAESRLLKSSPNTETVTHALLTMNKLQ